MVLFLRHSDQIIRGRTGPTRERDTQNAPAANLNDSGSAEVGRSLQIIAPASLSLCATGQPDIWALAGPRGQSGLHGQAPAPSDSRSSAPRTTAGMCDQSVGPAGIAAGVKARQRPWLIPDASTHCAAKLIMFRIVMCPKKSRKSIAGWCPSPSRGVLAGRYRS